MSSTNDTYGDNNNEVDSTTKSHRVVLSDDEERQVLDDILLDCDIADSCLMPRTFWIDDTMTPRCRLEQMAHDILQYYCPSPSTTSSTSTTAHPRKCGAEWWVQIRPSPESISRYTAPTFQRNDKSNTINTAGTDDKIDSDGDNACTMETDTDGISFHWDKDEDLRILCNGSVYVHPHLSTVTYLTDGGDAAAPTFIAEHVRVSNLTGEWIDRDSTQERTSAFISWPSQGKHLCFDGRYLHAAPSNLVNTSKKLLTRTEENKDPIVMTRRQRRYTFLVNIWLHHRPFNVHPFPESMIDKLSGSEQNRSNGLIRFVLTCPTRTNKVHDNEQIVPEKTFSLVTNVDVLSDTTARVSQNETSHEVTTNIEQFVWPMGDIHSNETIHVSVPIEILHSEKRDGGNIRIQWNNPTNDVSKNNSLSAASSVGMFLRKEPEGPSGSEAHDHNHHNSKTIIECDETTDKRPRCTVENDS